MKIVIITQVRLSSTRLPEKVLKNLNGVPALKIHLTRLKQSKRAQEVVVATTNEPNIDLVTGLCNELNINFFQGSMTDVLDRYYQTSQKFNADVVVRVTSDCPLIDPILIDQMIEKFLEEKIDFLSSNFSEMLPDGVDVEIMTFNALFKAWTEATLQSDREHVTPFIIRNSNFRSGNLFKAATFFAARNDSEFRITLDYKEDLEVIDLLVKELGMDKRYFEYIDYLKLHPEINTINNFYHQQGGYLKMKAKEFGLRYITNFEKSFEHRKKIHDLIPGGAHTYTKGDDQFPYLAPAAITHGLGSKVWDLDGNEYLDCAMGLTSVSLGHAYKPVIDRVKLELDKGVNFQRPSVIELEIAEKFLSLVPCHQMIKFAKNGSTATTAAVKLARAYTNRRLVAFPHDHPFYSYDDWFIGRTQASRGVPEEFKSLTVTYKSEDINSLKELFEKYPDQIAAVISEPEKPHGLPSGYLEAAVPFVQSQGALYIMDEMITGFKTAFPGSITKYNVKPDMATWGKGIANGFSFCCLTGTKEVMELGGIRNTGAEKVFLISTTHGGETSAIAAALATIDTFQKNDVVGHNHQIGRLMKKNITEVLKKKNLEDYIEYQSADWMQVFIFKNKKKEICSGMRTLMLQEMIKYGVLFQGAFVPCFSHTEEDVNYFVRAFDASLDIFIKALEEGYQKFLIGEPTKPVFRKIL